jgi:hypothetical protein
VPNAAAQDSKGTQIHVSMQQLDPWHHVMPLIDVIDNQNFSGSKWLQTKMGYL